MDILDILLDILLKPPKPFIGLFFEHINILESCNQSGIDNKSSNFIPKMVSCLEIKIQGFFCKKILRFDKHTL